MFTAEAVTITPESPVQLSGAALVFAVVFGVLAVVTVAIFSSSRRRGQSRGRRPARRPAASATRKVDRRAQVRFANNRIDVPERLIGATVYVTTTERRIVIRDVNGAVVAERSRRSLPNSK